MKDHQTWEKLDEKISIFRFTRNNDKRYWSEMWKYFFGHPENNSLCTKLILQFVKSVDIFQRLNKFECTKYFMKNLYDGNLQVLVLHISEFRYGGYPLILLYSVSRNWEKLRYVRTFIRNDKTRRTRRLRLTIQDWFNNMVFFFYHKLLWWIV